MGDASHGPSVRQQSGFHVPQAALPTLFPHTTTKCVAATARRSVHWRARRRGEDKTVPKVATAMRLLALSPNCRCRDTCRMATPPQRSFGAALAGLLQTGTTLIKRGTVMGPLVPVVFLVAIVGVPAAWFFRDVAVFLDVPVVSAVLLLGVASVVFYYLRQYSRFALDDPDRLQSEHYRLESRRMQYIVAKDRQTPLPPDAVDGPARNPDLTQDEESTSEEPSP